MKTTKAKALQAVHLFLTCQIRRPQSYVGTLLAFLLLSCGSPAQQRKMAPRPAELIQNASTYLNRFVEVEIVEPLYGPSTPEELAKVEYGQVEIRIPEGMNGRVSLVPEAFKVNDPNRYRHKFDRVIESPLRVKGEFLQDDEMSTSEHRPVYVIRVSSVEPIVVAPSEKVTSLKDIKADPSAWDRRQIVYEGVYENRFEVSALDKEIWLEPTRKATIIGQPRTSTSGLQSNQVRVTGILFARPDARYGHLGGYRFQILANKIEYLAR